MRIAIYTAIFGGYDQLKDQPPFSGVDYICFSDSPSLRSRCWRVAYCEAPPEHSRITAKRFKTTPHLFLPQEYDISIWIDGSMVIVGASFIGKCLSSIGKWGISCMLHPVGNCIYQEAEGCFRMPKYLSQPIIQQAKHYREQGYPEQNGLAACGIIVRDLRSETVKEKVEQVGCDWFAENVKWSYQDQISFPYVLWKNEHWFDVLGIDYRDRSMFVLCDHASDE